MLAEVPLSVRVWGFSLPEERTQLLDAAFGSKRKFRGDETLSGVLASNRSVAGLYYDRLLRDHSQGRYQLNSQVWGQATPPLRLKFTAADFSAAELFTADFDAEVTSSGHITQGWRVHPATIILVQHPHQTHPPAHTVPPTPPHTLASPAEGGATPRSWCARTCAA